MRGADLAACALRFLDRATEVLAAFARRGRFEAHGAPAHQLTRRLLHAAEIAVKTNTIDSVDVGSGTTEFVGPAAVLPKLSRQTAKSPAPICPSPSPSAPVPAARRVSKRPLPDEKVSSIDVQVAVVIAISERRQVVVGDDQVVDVGVRSAA